MTDEPQSPTPSAADDPATADWTGVGTAFRTLGRALSGHAKQAGGAVSAARQDADNAADQAMGAALACRSLLLNSAANNCGACCGASQSRRR